MTEAVVMQTPHTAKPKPARPNGWSAWTVGMVRAAITAHERGDFRRSGLLADALTRDDRIFATLESRVLGVLGLPYRSEPADGTAPTIAKRYAATLDTWWFDSMPEPTQAELLRWSHLMGFAVAELTWYKHEDGKIYPTAYVHHPSKTSWNEEAQAYEIENSDGKVERVVPGDGRWVLFTPHGSTRPHMRGMLRALAIPYLLRSFARRDWARRSETEGTGVRKAIVPLQCAPQIAEQFLADVMNLGEETTLKLPAGFDYKIEALDKSAHEVFEKLLAHGESAITITILGQNLTTQVEGGSFAAAGVHKSVGLDRIKSDVATLETCGRNQVIRPWFLYNEPNLRADLIPWPKYDATPPEDLAKFATALQSLSQALTALIAAGVDVEPLLKRFELRLVENPPTPPTNPADTPPPQDSPPNGQDQPAP